jgi:hypothetical protein
LPAEEIPGGAKQGVVGVMLRSDVARANGF